MINSDDKVFAQGAPPKSFEEALERLEEIAQLLDRGAPLAESLNLCAEAAELLKYCRTQLGEAEGKLEQLVESANGSVRLEPLGDE